MLLTPAADVSSLTSQLPWGWYAVLGAVDLVLLVLFIRQRRNRRLDEGANQVAADGEVELTGAVRRDGWLIPADRASSIGAEHGEYRYPIHREYITSRLGDGTA